MRGLLSADTALFDVVEADLAPADIEAEARRPWNVLRFRPRLEAAFLRATADRRRRNLVFVLVCLTVLCAAALPVDLAEGSDLRVAGLLRLAVLLPLQLACLLVLRRAQRGWVAAAAVLVSATSAVFVVCLIGELAAPDLITGERYFLVAGGIVFTLNFIAPLQFWHAVWGTAAMLAVYDGMIVRGVIAGDPGLATFAVFVTAIALFSLVSRFRLERAERSEFLARVLQTAFNRELHELTRRLTQLASTDMLTGIPNRRAFEETFEDYWARASAEGRWLGVLMTDVDHFKAFNDAAGHDAGDDCLRSIATLLRSKMEAYGGSVARYGGEEFVGVIPNADPGRLREVAHDLCSGVERLGRVNPGLPGGRYVTLSVGGTSLKPHEALRPSEVLRVADMALYEAKSGGRNRFVCRQTPHIAPEESLPDAAAGNGGSP